MANLKTDSSLAVRIVRAFFDFLDSVEPAAGVDVEGLEVARECLSEVFKLDSVSTADDSIKPGLLADLFHSLGANADHNIKSDLSHASSENAAGGNQFEASRTQGYPKMNSLGNSLLPWRKFTFLTPDGNEEPVQLDKATHLFHDALNSEIYSSTKEWREGAGGERGLSGSSDCNRAMQAKIYSDAIELYSCVISLCENNAVYYCNRASAYTQIHKYDEAIRDCLKSVEIDSNYSKAYSCLGLAYYAQGNYKDASDKGFRKALQLDPHNELFKENIRVAEQKLKEKQQRTGWDQSMNSTNYDGQEFNSHVPPFTSMPFNTNDIPVDFTNVLRNLAAQVYTGEHPSDGQRDERSGKGSDEPGIRVGGNINVNLGENIPDELRGALRSMMGIFSGVALSGNPQTTNTTNGRSRTN